MHKPAPRRNAFRILIALSLLVAGTVLVLGIAGIALFSFLDGPAVGIPPEGALFTVNAGESGSGIARRLEQEGLIRSAIAFEGFLRLEGRQAGLKRGTYRIENGMSSRAIMTLLVSGRQALVRVTIPEGSTLRRIANILDKAGIVSVTAFLDAARDKTLLGDLGIPGTTAEGYLFPDTYFMAHDMGATEVVRVLVSALRARLAERLPESASLSPAELHKRIILASIVEREYRLPEEAPRIAGVFWNRLRIGMALQSCATVVYVITEIQGKPHPEVLYNRDIEIQHPFNSYLHPGLPPGPISNPGMTALTAVFRPESSRFLYFRLLDHQSGRHYFSESLDEHIKAGSLAVKSVEGR